MANEPAKPNRPADPTPGKPPGAAPATPAAKPAAPPAGAPTLRGYEVVRAIGQPGDDVWLAIELTSQRKVALKIVGRGANASERIRRRLQKRLMLTNLIRHQQISRVFDSGLAEGLQYCVTELIEGPNIEGYARAQKREPAKVIPVLIDACKVLHAIHDHGVTHLGIKPTNVLVNRRGQAVITDLGLTKSAYWDDADKPGTLPAEDIGIADYIAPEQAAGRYDQIDKRADVYSMGAVAYRVLLGREPHDPVPDHKKKLMRIASEEITPPRQVDANFNPELEAVLNKALAKNPADRYATAEELAEDLRNFLDEKPVTAMGNDFKYKLSKQREKAGKAMGVVGTQVGGAMGRFKWVIVGGVAAVVLLALVFMGVGMYQRSQDAKAQAAVDAKVSDLLNKARERIKRDTAVSGLALVDEALRLKPNNPDAAKLREQLEAVMGPKTGTIHVNTLGMKLAALPPGEFKMGSPESEANRREDELQHTVKISRGFHMAVTPVTVGLFRKFLKESEQRAESEPETTDKEKDKEVKSWKNPGFTQGDEDPVVMVTYNDAVKFCNWLSRVEKLPYRLPTEAEWEYACRAGTTTAYFWGDDIAAGKGNANVADVTYQTQFSKDTDCIAWADGFIYTSPVGSFKPNAWGLYDMIGNVAQWCQDAYAPYTEGKVVDPNVTTGSETRVIRGASWRRSPGSVGQRDPSSWYRSAARYHIGRNDTWDTVGFRVVLDVEEAPKVEKAK